MLTHIPLAFVTAHRLMTLEAHSALPHAPVQPAAPAPAPRTIRTRRAMATALHRAGNVVSPA